MSRRTLLTFLLGLCAIPVMAQDLGNLQIHGFATQGFLFSSANNYLTMPSSRGSLLWTDGGISVIDSLSDNLRVGMQIHMYQMGEIGGPNIAVDWASGDYHLNDQLGFRAGKIKIPMGFYNDSQDVDSLFLWTLLPQSTYPTDNRDYDLSLLGGEVYGERSLGTRRGSVQYRGYVGESTLDAHGGYVLQLAGYGATFPNPPAGKDFGGDIRWLTPWRGLMVGASAQSQALDGTGPQGSVHMPPSFMYAYYAEWRKGKADFVGEYWRTPLYPVLTLGADAFSAGFDQRAWYGMASYRVTPNLQLGAYYSHYFNKAGDTSLPENYSKDWVVSGRYDFNQNFYGKVEGHFLHGTGLGYYASTNPNGLQPNANMLAARVGFTF
ncbi:MAG TPA: hypothetical protein VE377_14735 [Candidatus Dormibacteraeota bacterium]|nr:hypothetical protein [Candidatus Dormibacteraeota bacterium]